VYKASLSILRQKAAHLGALAAAIIVCITIDATMALGRLRDEREMLQSQLKYQTQELFGEPRLDGRQVAPCCAGASRTRWPPCPRPRPTTCWRDLPQGSAQRRDQAGHPGAGYPTQEGLHPRHGGFGGGGGRLQERLNTIECFEEITKGPINEVSGGAKSFTLTIASKC
jgi:hypothetical protein